MMRRRQLSEQVYSLTSELQMGGTFKKGPPSLRRLAALVTSCCLLAILVGFSFSSPKQQTSLRNTRKETSQCNIFLAPSSLKGVTALGLYSTRDISSDESIFQGTSSDISIPVVDFWEGPEVQNNAREQWVSHFSEYWWAHGVPDHVTYEANYGPDIQINFGAFPNHHCILHAIQIRYPIPPYDDSLLNRSKDPGIGAFTYSMGRDFYATKNIQAGDEIFLNYGHCNRNNEDSTSWRSSISVTEDYEEAARICRELYNQYKQQQAKDVNGTVEIPPDTDRRVAALIPKSVAELHDVMSGNKNLGTLVTALARKMSVEHRTLEWIRSNGLCVDHLVTRKSLLPQAGHGGFAQRRIRKGELVVPAPMLHIADKDVLNIYDENGNQFGQQLLLNYCLGHPESSLLLCPLTNAIIINHCSKRRKQCGPKGPNAEYRWAVWQPTSNEWLTKTIEEIGNHTERGLAMEIFALRDIKPGEEVYIDYGEAWEDAWEKHVASWKPPPPLISLDGKSEELFVTAKEANENEGPLDILVSRNIREIPRHPYLFTGCQYYTTESDKDAVWDTPNLWEELTDEEILKLYADDGSDYKGDYSNHGDRTYWPCSVFRKEANDTYVVRIHHHSWYSQQKWHKNKLPRLLTSYPRESIHYFVKPYASDQHLPGVFRHPIGIRDEIFPAQWKNRKKPGTVTKF